jgi:hypothetical protein
MASRAPLHSYSYAEYVALEEHSPVRHEFVAGEIYAMAGGTPGHAALAATVLRLVGNQLPAGCRAYTSDLRVRVAASDSTAYPDGAVTSGRSLRAEDDPVAVTNPILLIEVTRPSAGQARPADEGRFDRSAARRELLASQLRRRSGHRKSKQQVRPRSRFVPGRVSHPPELGPARNTPRRGSPRGAAPRRLAPKPSPRAQSCSPVREGVSSMPALAELAKAPRRRSRPPVMPPAQR